MARNRVNGMLYIGQTICELRERKSGHLRDALNGADRVFQRSIRKYGPENFEWFILQKCSDCFLLNEAERFWISTLNTFAPNGYNMNGGGAGMFRITQELREKMSRIKKAGPHSSPEHMKKMSDAIRGKKETAGSEGQDSGWTQRKA